MPAGRKKAAVRNPFNNIRPYKPIRPGEPVPEPLPPAPLLGPKELLGLGALVLIQLWGLLAGRPKTAEPDPSWNDFPFVGTRPQEGNATPGDFLYGPAAGTQVDYAGGGCKERSLPIAGHLFYLVGGVVGVAGLETTAGSCGGFRTIMPRFQLADGSTVLGQQLFGEYYGIKSIPGIRTEWQGPAPEPWAAPTTPIPLPPGYEPSPAPELDPLEEPERAVPALPPRPVIPVIPGEPVTPETPGPSVPPSAPQVPRPVPPSTPQVPGSVPTQDGTIVPAKPGPTPTTPGDVVFPVPGGPPVGGIAQSPPATLEGIAQETGRIEKKLEALMSPAPDTLGERWRLLLKALDAFWNMNQGGTYSLVEPCDPDGDGRYERRDVSYPGALDALGVLSNKLDALAELQQAAKDLRQPTCSIKTPVSGSLVTVNFQSLSDQVESRYAVKKVLSYRDQTGSPEEVHVAHWQGFEWHTGPAIVSSRGAAWGEVQVWARDHDEGERVIRHAAQVAGVDLTSADHRWLYTQSRNPRYGRQALVRVPRWADTGKPMVSKRNGASSSPGFMRDP